MSSERLSGLLLRLGPEAWHPGEIAHWCPACEELHGIAVDKPNASGARWTWNGNPERPTFAPSVNRRVGPFPDGRVEVCHYFITNGRIEFCSDCTHALAGRVVDLPALPADPFGGGA